jgi:hypothetical protein
MDTLTIEAKEYVLAMWNMVAIQKQIEQAIQRYDDYCETLMPANTPFAVAKYIHKERMLYDLFMDDEIMVFRYDPNEDDFRDQLAANEFVGGYWKPHMYWVLPKKALLEALVI